MKLFSPRSRDATHAGWYQRLFAAMMARGSVASEPLVAERKRALLGELRGSVLEIGPGTGVNLTYYQPDVQWLGIEPNPHMHTYVQQAAAQLGRAIELRRGTAEQLPVADESVDAVVGTLVLCSVPNPAATLHEIKRVLKPGGRFVFVEHVAAPRGTWMRRFQRWISPLWNMLGDGCHPDRETWTVIEDAGFTRVQLEHFQLPGAIIGPHISGTAIK
jgi:ubiquinone/menaquinone biosynthesis C-methylase UbiE